MQMSSSLGGGPPPSSTGINNFCQVNQQGGTFSSKLMCHLFIWIRWDAYFAKLPCWTHSFACPSSTTVTLMAVENEVGKGGRREEAVGKVGRDGRWLDRGAVAGESHWQEPVNIGDFHFMYCLTLWYQAFENLALLCPVTFLLNFICLRAFDIILWILAE